MLRRYLVAALAAGLLAACATTTIDPQAKAGLSSVYVEPVQLSKVTVFAANARESGASAGKAPATVAEATARLQRLVDARVGLPAAIESSAKRELQVRGYRVTDDPSKADARLKLIANHALSVPAGPADGRGIAMTVSAEMVRVADAKRLLFANANQVKDPARQGVRLVSYAEWFSNDDLVVDQYRLIARLLTAQALEGL